MNLKTSLIAAAFATLPMYAGAATVNIDITSFGSIANNDRDFDAARQARDLFMSSNMNGGKIVRENFSGPGFTPCDMDAGTSCTSTPSTAVGDFSALGDGVGSGESAVQPRGEVVIRTDIPNAFGRYALEGMNWLDSNDNEGISWAIPGASGLRDITHLSFFLTDVDDFLNFDFQIDVTGDVSNQLFTGETISSGRPDGELLLVTMLFDQRVNDLTINMRAGLNDGFGVDDVSVAAVPLPAGGVLLLSALGGFAFLRRRRQQA